MWCAVFRMMSKQFDKNRNTVLFEIVSCRFIEWLDRRFL